MICVSRSPQHLEIRFSATLENIGLAAKETRQFLAQAGKPQHIFHILLIMHEALANAVVHGCRNDPEATVSYLLRNHGGDIVMEVEDEGNGFAWQDAICEESLPDSGAEHGRGLCLIRHYASSYEFNQAGNRITITRTCSTGGSETEDICAVKNQ